MRVEWQMCMSVWRSPESNSNLNFPSSTVATYQTLLQPQRLAKFHPNTLKTIIVDEAHHAAAPS